MKIDNPVWSAEDEKMVCRCASGVQFSDTTDHWKNGVLRLLGIDEKQAVNWINRAIRHSRSSKNKALSELGPVEQSAALKAAWNEIFPLNDTLIQPHLSNESGPCGHCADIVWSKGVGFDDRLSVVGCSKCQHGWLRDVDGNVPETIYEQEYFEGNRHGLGYGNYLQQQAWRMEKARRMLRQTRGACKYAGLSFSRSPCVLDVGSGYGFFRKAVDEVCWIHDGLEVSAHACGVTRELFGFETVNGTLSDYVKNISKQYDLVTMWDVIEHVNDPVQLLKDAASLLSPGGVCAIRTPNLLAVERDIFERHYHSFKSEHLQFFSAQSLALFARKAGLYPAFMATQSNLLQGFSFTNSRIAEVTLRGADLFVVLVRI